MYQKLSPEENWKNLCWTEKFHLLFWKIEFFSSKNHWAFLTIERYDIELTNINISDKNIVPPGGVQGPERKSFLLLFWSFTNSGAKSWVSKKDFPVENFIVYGNKHHYLTRKIGFKVIS